MKSKLQCIANASWGKKSATMDFANVAWYEMGVA